jgi:hypothetical protein
MSDYQITLTEQAFAEIVAATDGLAAVKAVASDADARAADAAIRTAKTIVKVVHDQRMAVTRRIDALKKECMGREAEICAPMNQELERVTKLTAQYVAARKAEQEREYIETRVREEEERASMEAEAMLTGKAPAEIVATPSASAPQGKPVAGVSSRTVWQFDITDAAAVPRAYCAPSPELIREYMTAAKRNGAAISQLAIPGVTFREEVRV